MDVDWIRQHVLAKDGKRFINWAHKQSWWINREHLDDYEKLLERSSDIEEACYRLLNEVDSIPLCHCGQPRKFNSFVAGYRTVCSKRCMWSDPERNRKIGKNRDMDAIVAKVKVTNLRKYGVDLLMKLDTFQQKCRDGKLALYGDPTYSNPEQMKATNLQRYGVEHVYQNADFQRRCQEAKLKKYGAYFPSTIEQHTSKAEIELRDWLNAQGYNFQPNYGVLPHGMELDCYDPSCQYAFEYCGLYWHSTQFKIPQYHRHKMNLATEVGLKLVTVFEDEWLDRQDQVKDFILAKLGQFNHRIYARQCTIVEDVSRKQAKAFFADNHIQSYSSIMYRWFMLVDQDNQIVGGVSFSKHHRQNGGNHPTLSRLAFRRGIQIVGGAAKLIAYAKRVVGPFVTWSDNRWTDGSIYGRCGLVNDREYYCDYAYVDGGRNRIAKQSMTKRKLGCPKGMTEGEYCLKLGYHRIYDCGKKRWIYEGE